MTLPSGNEFTPRGWEWRKSLRRLVSARWLAVPMALLLLVGCAVLQQMSPSYREAERRAEAARALQLEVMRFADEYASRLRAAINIYQAGAVDPVDRLFAQDWILLQTEAVFTVASGEDPLTNALDVVVLASLSRMVIEDVWMKTERSDRVLAVYETHRALEQAAWSLVREPLGSQQEAQLERLIARWRSLNPQVQAVGYIHFADFAESLGAPLAGEERAPGSLFSLLGLDPFTGLDPAVREIAEARQLAERSMFYLQRAPRLLNMHLERLTYQAAAMPETKAVLADMERASLIGAAADLAVQSLPDVLAKEREALVRQLMQELGSRSEDAIALSGDVRSTLQAGTDTANALHATLLTLERISSRRSDHVEARAAPDAERFDINEYTLMLEELAATTREINVLVERMRTSLPEIRATTENVSEHAQDILDRLLIGLLILVGATIALTLSAALLYRALLPRVRRFPARRAA